MATKMMGTIEGNEKYGWTKWGGGWYGYASHNKIRDEWACQACGEKQPEELKPYMFKLFDREYVRICAICKHISKAKRIKTYHVLIRVVRKTTYF